MDTGAGVAGLIVVLLAIAAAVGAYLVPSIVALIRKVPNVGSVLVVNVLLGWTLVGWAVALAMASRSLPPSGVTQQVTVMPVGTSGGAAPAHARDDGGPGWYADPAGRHQLRYWNGAAWTQHTADGGVPSIDPLYL